MTKRKESEDYKKIKSILRNKNNIKTFHQLLNRYKYDYRNFKLDKIDINFLLAIISMKKIKFVNILNDYI